MTTPATIAVAPSACIPVSYTTLFFIAILGAIFMRVSVNTYNFVTGGDASPRAVPELPFLKAVIISILSMVGFFLAAWTSGSLAVTLKILQRPQHPNVTYTAMFTATLIMAALFWKLLPTTLLRACLLTFCHYMVILLSWLTLTIMSSLVASVLLT